MVSSLSSSSSKIMTGVFPCDLELGGGFVGPGELRGRRGLFTIVCDGAVVGRCGSPEDSDFDVFPDRFSSIF